MQSIILDITIIGLLIGVMGYSWYLSRKLKLIKGVSSELAPILQNLSQVVSQVSINIDQLRRTSLDVKESLDKQLPKASALKDDLAFLMEHGDKLGDRLDRQFDLIRNAQKKAAPTAPQPPKKKRGSVVPLRTEDTEEAKILSKLKHLR